MQNCFRMFAIPETYKQPRDPFCVHARESAVRSCLACSLDMKGITTVGPRHTGLLGDLKLFGLDE